MTIENTDVKIYRKHRQEIKSGDLLAWSTDSAVGLSAIILRVIRFFTVSEYAHVGVALRLDERLYVVEASIPHIRLKAVSETEEFYHVPMEVDWSYDKELHLRGYIGCNYSIFEAVKAYLGMTVREDTKWQCAEMANRFYKFTGVDFGNKYTPSNLVKEIIKVTSRPVYFVRKD